MTFPFRAIPRPLFCPASARLSFGSLTPPFHPRLQLQLRATFLLLIIILSSATSKRKKKYARWSVKKATLYGVPRTWTSYILS